MRYSTPCVEETGLLLCAQCDKARCVVIEFHDEGVPAVEHISSDDLIIDPEDELEKGARVIRP